MTSIGIKKHRQRGQAMVEFAIVAGLVLLLSFAPFQFLFAYYQKHAMYLAAKQGVAEIVTTTKTDPDDIRAAVKDKIAGVLAKYVGKTKADAIVTNAVIHFSTEPGSSKTAPATVQLTTDLWIPVTKDKDSPFFISGISVKASAFQNHFNAP